MNLTDFDHFGNRLLSGESSSDVFLDLVRNFDKYDCNDFRCAVAIVAREPFDNIGVGKSAARDVIKDGFDVTSDELSDLETEHGDLPTVTKVLKRRTQTLTPRQDLGLNELYRSLIGVRDGTTDGKDELRSLVGTHKHPEWIVHAFLGEDGYTFGIGPKGMVNALEDEYGPFEARRARALCPDVSELAVKIVSPRYSVPQKPEVGKPFKPMLAKDKDVPEDPGDDWLIQRKYDGARILVHISGGELKAAFSRNCNDVTDSLPELQAVVEEVFGDVDGGYIIDGEAIAYKDGERQSFRKIMTRFNRQDAIDEQDIDVRFKFFDLPYAYRRNGILKGDLSREDAHSRLYLMLQLFDGYPDYLAETKIPDGREELLALFRSYREDGYEGAVVKHADSKYEFDRYSPDWRKMIENKENADLRISAYHEGEDNAAGKLGALSLETEDGVAVGKVGTGFDSEEMGALWERRDELVGEIAEVSWRELQQDDDGEYGVRFPSFEGLRPDKDEADTIEWMEAQ